MDGFGEALLGTLLLARLPSQSPEAGAEKKVAGQGSGEL